MIDALIVFCSLTALDYCWARYIQHLAAKHATLAGLWSSAIVFGSAIAVIKYTENHWLVLPAIMGAFAGTWLAVWWPRIQYCCSGLDNPALDGQRFTYWWSPGVNGDRHLHIRLIGRRVYHIAIRA